MVGLSGVTVTAEPSPKGAGAEWCGRDVDRGDQDTVGNVDAEQAGAEVRAIVNRAPGPIPIDWSRPCGTSSAVRYDAVALYVGHVTRSSHGVMSAFDTNPPPAPKNATDSGIRVLRIQKLSVVVWGKRKSMPAWP